jgi:quercetin dioxygenase-like cupin family protein
VINQMLEVQAMQGDIKRRNAIRRVIVALFAGAFSFAAGSGHGLTQETVPTEHKGLSVKTLGVMPADSVKATTGLDGHILLLREITIAPGGHIAKHSHAKIPGIVQMVSGEWIEGRDGGERSLTTDTPALLEDENTVNWFFNRGTKPATAIVCDIKPAS